LFDVEVDGDFDLSIYDINKPINICINAKKAIFAQD
jgi:predicted nucleotidyltransferase